MNPQPALPFGFDDGSNMAINTNRVSQQYLSQRRRGELTNQDGSNQEHEAVDQVTDDQRPAATKAVDEQNTHSLGNERKDVVDGLVLERIVAVDANLLEDVDGEVLDRRDTGHLNGSLESASNE